MFSRSENDSRASKSRVDWKALDKVGRYRNKIEHYYDTDKLHADAVREHILTCFKIACSFSRKYLEIDPQSLFSPEAWSSWLNEEAIYEAERRACAELMSNVEFEYGSAAKNADFARCEMCESHLIKPVIPLEKDPWKQEFRCSSCGEQWEYGDLVFNGRQRAKEVGEYAVYHDGDSPTIVECPSCDVEAHDVEEDECALCGESGPHYGWRCSAEIEPEKLCLDSGNTCGWCLHQSMKND